MSFKNRNRENIQNEMLAIPKSLLIRDQEF